MVRSESAASRMAVAGYAIWFCAWLAITVVGILLTPHPDGHGTHRQLGFPPCPSVLFFQRPCPGCGLTTSWTALLHGDFASAFRAHPFGPILYIGFTISGLMCLWAWIGRRTLIYRPALNRLLLGFILVFLAFSAWRFINPPANYLQDPFSPPLVSGSKLARQAPTP